MRATTIPMRLVVSMDDYQEARTAVECDIELIARPAELAADNSLSGEAVRAAEVGLEERRRTSSEVAVFLPLNAPTRPPGLTERACEIQKEYLKQPPIEVATRDLSVIRSDSFDGPIGHFVSRLPIERNCDDKI